MSFDIKNFFSFALLLITISSVNQFSSLPIGNTYFWYGNFLGLLFAFIYAKHKYFDKSNNIKIILLYLGWNFVCIIRGATVADNYWEWKNLVNTSLVLMLPLSIYISTHAEIIQKILRVWVKYALPAFFLFIPFFIHGDAFGRYLVPISFLALFFALLPTKWKIIVAFFTLFVLFVDLDARSNIIKFSLCFMLGLTYYFRKIFTTIIAEVLRLLLLSVPLILFVLACTGKFNIFNMDEYIGGNYTTTVVQEGETFEADLTADTRTLLYEEVLSSAKKYDYIIAGRTPARGNESNLFGSVLSDELKTGKMERFSNEVSILNVFTWTGVIGVVLYFLVFFQASYLAIHKSNNFFIRIVGLYVAFRWTYAWVEDFSEIDLYYFLLWVMIGMCYSKSFREMNNLEMKYWILGIFDKRYKNIKLFNMSNVGVCDNGELYQHK